MSVLFSSLFCGRRQSIRSLVSVANGDQLAWTTGNHIVSPPIIVCIYLNPCIACTDAHGRNTHPHNTHLCNFKNSEARRLRPLIARTSIHKILGSEVNILIILNLSLWPCIWSVPLLPIHTLHMNSHIYLIILDLYIDNTTGITKLMTDSNK